MSDIIKRLSKDEFDPEGAIRFEYKVNEATDEKKRQGILCSIEGVFQRADVENLNKRTYPKGIFEKLFSDPKFKEQLEKRRMVGMMYHPANGQTDPEKISHVVTKQELMSDGIVNGAADVLDTPCGRIAETLFRAGIDWGISSRGDGTLKQKGGTQEVQNDYWMSTYDLVLDPSVDIARPKLVENVGENNRLVANAISGLVESELPDESKLAVLSECLKILGVLEGIDSSDQVTRLSQHIQELLQSTQSTTVVSLRAADPKKPQEESMSGTSIPGVAIPQVNPQQPQVVQTPAMMSPDTLSWHQAELAKAVDAAKAEKDVEVSDLRKEAVEVQREHRKLKTRYEAAKEVIEDLHSKVQENKGDDRDYVKLKERYDAAVDLLDESIKKLKKFGGVERRVATLEGLLDASMKKLMRERVGVKIKECLADVPAHMKDTIRESLEECPNPSQVDVMFKRLMAIQSGRPVRREKNPLPEKRDPQAQDPRTESRPVAQPTSFAAKLGSVMNNL